MDRIVITTIAGYEEALHAILASLRGHWPASQIVVVYGGCRNDAEKESVVTQEPDGHIVVRVKQNLYEYIAFLVPQALRQHFSSKLQDEVSAAAAQTFGDSADAFLLLHDTCRARPDFKACAERAFRQFRDNADDILWCSESGQCNICVFNERAARAVVASSFPSMMTLDKTHGVAMELNKCEDSPKRACNIKQAYAPVRCCLQGRRRVYSTGTRRHVLHFPFVDIEKYYVSTTAPTQQHPQRP